MGNGLLSLNDTTLNFIKQKHPCLSEADKHFLFHDIPHSIHKIKYEYTDTEVIWNTGRSTRGGSGSWSMDAVGWRILTSNSFGQSFNNKCMVLANFAKELCVETDQIDPPWSVFR